MTVAADAGEYNDIHPKAKKVLAERMTLTALGTVYKTIAEEKSLSPLYKAKLPVGNELKLYFENAPEGFIYKADNFELERYKELEAIQGNTLPEAFTGFEIAGADKSFYPAQYTFGKGSEANTITLSSPKVAKPLYARYAWYNYGPVTIFSKAGLPLGPFRTDTENAVKTEHAKIQQIMTVSGGN